ncbi:MAG TPA: CDGSH iron-sulfur domain-containing protein [Bacteroidia bacterium]|jgi:CDGSH-type Zn-finger protein|nr:CDGSH iron-sulfur domain-containing protein [Bacteroidia bacterium]
MDTPNIAQKANYPVELQPGTYFWCACGLSKNQPFCDDSHIGTKFEPVEFVIAETKTVKLCGCKLSSKAPFCDGFHKTLIEPTTPL